MSRIRTFAAVIIIALSLASCHDKSKFLVNTWKLDDQKFDRPILEEEKPIVEALVKHLKETLRVTYKADGTYEHNDGSNVYTGKWKFNKDQTQLTCSDDKGREIICDVVELTKDKFVTSSKENGTDKITYYFSPAGSEPVKGVPAPETAPTDSTKKAL